MLPLATQNAGTFKGAMGGITGRVWVPSALFLKFLL
jgi:hypothetical protein